MSAVDPSHIHPRHRDLSKDNLLPDTSSHP